MSSFVSSVLPPTLQPENCSVVSSSRTDAGAGDSCPSSVECPTAAPPRIENHRAVTAFQQEFNYRVWSSVTAHPNKFNGAQTTHKTGPRGGKIKSTVYRDWVEANGGEWVGFQWQLLGD